MNNRLSRRFLIRNLNVLNLSEPLRYERYYIDDNCRIQKRGEIYEIEHLNNNNERISKKSISKEKFAELKANAKKAIIRDSYLIEEKDNYSIKEYFADYEGLVRLEVEFKTKEEMESFKAEKWIGKEITETSLAFDKDLSKLNREEFLNEMSRINNE